MKAHGRPGVSCAKVNPNDELRVVLIGKISLELAIGSRVRLQVPIHLQYPTSRRQGGQEATCDVGQ